MATIKIARGSDPFKKYWWVILAVFFVLGVGICLPALNGGASGAATEDSSGLQVTEEGGLDSQQNPNGARGGVVDLSMDGAKKTETPSVASLYQAGAEPAAAASTAAVAAAAPETRTLADSLRDVTRASAASAQVEAGGWGERAQKGWTPPAAGLASMGGLGGGGGSTGARMAAGLSGGAGGSSSFGSATARVGSTTAKGLKDSGDHGKEAPTAMGRLQSAHSISVAASYNNSADAARSGGGTAFDGRGGATRSLGGGGGGGGGNFYGSLDAAPSNLKGSDPKKINQKKITPPPLPTPTPTPPSAMAQMGPQMQSMAMSMVIGGIMSAIGL